MAEQVRNVCGKVTYDGTDFNGFQLQAGVPTIQGTLEDALAQASTLHSRVAGAGRTDTGVHASGQVIGVQVAWRHSLVDLQNAWNARLPRSVAVRELVDAPAGFHPRFSAEQRTYRYYVIEGDHTTLGRSPLTDRFALYVPHALLPEAMQAAAMLMVGEHDFATFGQPTRGESTVRRILRAEWQVVTDLLTQLHEPARRHLVFTVTANGFLRMMVRRLVGTFLAVGRGDWSLDRVAEALAAADRRYAAPPAAAHGLILEQVVYPVQLDPWHNLKASRPK